MNKCTGNGLAIGLCIVTACLAIVARVVYLMGKSRNSHSGSVADLVRRGQLRSDRRGMYDLNLWDLCSCGHANKFVIIPFPSSLFIWFPL